MNKQQALEKLDALEREAAELRAIIEKPKVKPLFPESFEEGARFVAHSGGCIEGLCEDSHMPEWVEDLSKQGRTFYTHEAAKDFIKRERAAVFLFVLSQLYYWAFNNIIYSHNQSKVMAIILTLELIFIAFLLGESSE